MSKVEVYNLPKPATLIIVTGMPGSGKSTYMAKLKDEYGAVVYDDYQAKIYGNEQDPRLSKHFGPLIAHLKSGKTVIVSDIRLCVPQELGRLLGAILSVAPNTMLRFVSFANNPEQAKKNVMTRQREGRTELEVGIIDELSKWYVPVAAEVVPVYRAESK